MPRNANGVYSLPSGNPVVPGTLIESTWANPTMSDLGNEITQSLPRNGSAPMTGPLILSRDGTLPKEATTVDQLNALVGSNNNYLQAGAIQYFAAATIPTGWLLADGSAVSRTTYANLFSVIGTIYGAGNGATTFNLPDLRGMFIRSADMGRSVDPGRVVGSFQNQANAPHTHNVSISDPGHTHSINDPGHKHSVNDPGHIHSAFQAVHDHTLTTVAHNHGITDPGHTHPLPASNSAGAGGADGPRLGASDYPQVASKVSSAAATGISLANAAPTGTTNQVQPTVTVNAVATNVTLNAVLSGVYNSLAATNIGTSTSYEGTEARPKNVALVACIKAFGALQTDGLGSMAFQNKEAVQITGGSGAFTTLSCATAPVNPTDVARLQDISGTMGDIFCSDEQVILVDKTNPTAPILRPQTNIPHGMVKLDAYGKVPNALLDPTGYNYQGTWDASGGTLPGGAQLDGSMYYIDVAGTLNLYHSNGVQSATACSIGTRIVYVTDSPTLPVPGWYYEPPPTLAGATASQVAFVPAGTISATDVQAAIVEVAAEAVQKDSDTGAAQLPVGTVAQRPASPVKGQFRYNDDADVFEGYTEGTGWGQVGGGQMYGTAAVKSIFFNAQHIAEDLTVAAGQNGGTFGPITVDNGFTVTVASGSVWSVV